MKRIESPTLVAWAAALVGVVGIVSASTPEMADRYDVVRGVLPQGLPTAARILTLAFGLALLWLSRGLARRKQRAWQLAVTLVIASAITHLVKGLDFEEAIGSLAVLAILLRTRRQFVAPGDPASVMPLVQVGIGMAAVAAILALHIGGTAGVLGGGGRRLAGVARAPSPLRGALSLAASVHRPGQTRTG